jgi:hypothetical protein
MATVNVAYDEAMKEIDRREREPKEQAQPNGSASRGTGRRSSWANQFSTVLEPPPERKQYPDTVKGRVHRAYDEEDLSAAIALARKLRVKPTRFKRWKEDFEFDAEWE